MPNHSPDDRRDLRDLSIRLILLLGIVSLCGSLISNGARSVTGPYILLLGGSAAVVGLVAGFGEFIGYALRSATGAYVDQSRRYWNVAMGGYGLLAVIPLLAFVHQWEAAALLIIAERIGKAIRTPARDTILSHATTAIGRGWGFGVHKALDQVGAVIGPLVMAAALAATGGYAPGFLLLGIPLAGVAVIPFFARSSVPRPGRLEADGGTRVTGDDLPGVMPYATFIFLGMAGFANFPLISFHLKAQSVIPDAAIPLYYASAMMVSVVVALLIGRVFSNLIENSIRHGVRVTTITFSLERDGDGYIILYEDDGVGVAADEKEKIFSYAYGMNTGLGLFLAREILAITGITIRETGTPGVGARFELLCPGEVIRAG